MPPTLKQIEQKLDNYLFLPDKGILKLLCAFALSCKLPIPPLWLFISCGSSTGKALTPDHEILTNNGWKFINQIKIGDKVMAWDLPKASANNGQLIYAEVKGVYEQNHDGKIYVSKHQRAYFKASPDHRWYVSGSHDNNDQKNSIWRVIRSEDLPQHAHIPATGYKVDMPNSKFSGDELELIGWFIAEGCLHKKNMVRISQIKKDGRDKLEKLLQKLNLKYFKYTAEFQIIWRPLFNCGNNCYEKFIPRELFFEKERHRLLDGLIAGDGMKIKNKDKFITHNSWEYYTASKKLIDDIQELAMGLGWRTAISPKKVSYKYRGKKGNKKPKNGKGMFPGHYIKNWRIYGCTRPKWHLGKIETEYYKGKTYCLWVPGPGTFVARFKGTPFITGNTELLTLLEKTDGWYAVDDLTENAMLSGMKRFDVSSSMLDRVPDKGFLVFKDFTTMLSKNKDALGAIMGKLRVIYDGSYKRDTGGQVESKSWEGKLSLLAAGTGSIYSKTEEFNEMGTRSVVFKLDEVDDYDVGEFKRKHQKDDRNALKEELQNMVKAYVHNIKVPTEFADLPTINEDVWLDLTHIAHLASTARSPVEREKYGSNRRQTMIHQKEGMGRLFGQLQATAYGLMLQNEGQTLLPSDLKMLYKIGLDCIDPRRRNVLQVLTQNIFGGDTHQIGDATGYSKETTDIFVEDLYAHKMLDKSRVNGKTKYTIKEKYKNIISRFENIKPENQELPASVNENIATGLSMPPPPPEPTVAWEDITSISMI